MKGANFLLTTYRGREAEAAREIKEHLARLGDQASKTFLTDVNGIVLGNTSLDPLQVSEKLDSLAKNEPWNMRLVLRFIPIETEVETSLEQIVKMVKPLLSKIKADESFRVTVESRHSTLDKNDVIKKIAALVDNKVDLENPDWIVLVETIGNWTGISVLAPEKIFSSTKSKRS
ncbi:MAG: THUMP domain-containing protein [Conexivisphaerales archaeon]